jgi:hypothetical protein
MIHREKERKGNTAGIRRLRDLWMREAEFKCQEIYAGIPFRGPDSFKISYFPDSVFLLLQLHENASCPSSFMAGPGREAGSAGA